MQKWLFTYLLIVCSAGLSVCSFANAVKKVNIDNAGKSLQTPVLRGSTFKKAGLVTPAPKTGQNADLFFQHQSPRILYSVVFYFTAELIYLVKTSVHAPVTLLRKKEVERVLKDHLQHLFPSHYFW